MHRNLVSGLLALCLIVTGTAVAVPRSAVRSADTPLEFLPDTSDVRARYESLVSGPVRAALSFKPVTVTGVAGKVRVSVDRAGDSLAVVFAVGADGRFLSYSQGSYRFTRSLRSGSVTGIEVFLRSNAGDCARLYPFADRTKMDLLIEGRTVNEGVVISADFDRLVRLPFAGIVELTRDSVDWSWFSPDPRLSADTRSMVSVIRSRLRGLRDTDDGAMDSTGRYVFIATGKPQKAAQGGLNCSGFAKWVADGIYAPAVGHLLDIPALARKHPEARGNGFTDYFEDSLDPFFGLDWTRNIAHELAGLGTPDRDEPITANDVRTVPSYRYVENVGFPVPELSPLLYMLAVRDPSAFYFGSINGAYDTSRLRRHFHVVVLFPYFTEGGEFRTAVFERGTETSLASLARRYPKMSVHLVRAGTVSRFDPPGRNYVPEREGEARVGW